jgi:hypothetical protein
VKYVRCCLDREPELERLVGELEDTVDELGYDTWGAEREWCLARFAEFYDGGIEAFGLAGPSREELLEAHLWFLPDCPLPEGQTALWRLRQQRTGRAVELLARSELRAWRVEAVGASGELTGICPLGTGRARLEAIRRPMGDLRPGAVLVARSVPLGPERWALLGRAPVVEASVAAEFEALLCTVDAPRGEVWSVHGGVLARAAWAWPQTQELTIDGELAQTAIVAFERADVQSVLTVLDLDPELERVVGDPVLAAPRWRWRWDPPARRAPSLRPGVRSHLCSEDVDPRPYLAEIELDWTHEELWLAAPTPPRLALAERLLRARLPAALGVVKARDVQAAKLMPRWRRARSEQAAERAHHSVQREGGRAA